MQRSEVFLGLDMLSWLQGYDGLLLLGLWRTVLISVVGYAFGAVLGLGLALIYDTSGRPVRQATKAYSAVLRALPELILIMLLYYACGDVVSWLMAFVGFEHFQLSGTAAAIIVLGLVASAYAFEIFVAAMSAVPAGMVEAGASLGMGKLLGFRRIVLPLMLPLALPGLSNLWLMVVKGTSLVSVVGVMELALAAEQGAGATKSYFTFYVAAAGLYLALALLTLRFFNALEQFLRRGQVSP